MLRQPLLFLFLLTLSIGQVAAQSTLTSAEIFAKSSAAVLLIKTDKGSGTGFLVNGNGTIVTASHVVEGASRVAVKLMSGEVFEEVMLVVNDKKRDFAILKISGFDLPTVSLGNSNLVKPGEGVTAIGNPLGVEQLKNSVSTGIVSGIRDLEEGYKVIQMTASVSPGNSGGPVFNEKGEAIGIVVFGLVEGQNLNFIVPINYARGILQDLDMKKPLLTFGSLNLTESYSNAGDQIPEAWVTVRGSNLSVKLEGDLLLFQFEQSDLEKKLNVKGDFGSAKKDGDVYRGTYTHVYYEYYTFYGTLSEVCTIDTPVEIKFTTPRQIEVSGIQYEGQLDDLDKKCKPKKKAVPFKSTWVPR